MRRHLPSLKRRNTKKKESEGKEKEAMGEENESSLNDAESAPDAGGRKKLVRQKPSRQG